MVVFRLRANTERTNQARGRRARNDDRVVPPLPSAGRVSETHTWHITHRTTDEATRLDSRARYRRRATLVGYEAPDFTAEAAFDQEFSDVKLSDYRGKYVVPFFYPLDFTFVARRKSPPSPIATRSSPTDTEVLGCSVDSSFLTWRGSKLTETTAVSVT